MLDNMSPAQLEAAAGSLKSDFPSVIVEASGGITVDTIQDYMVEGTPGARETGVGGGADAQVCRGGCHQYIVDPSRCTTYRLQSQDKTLN
jgi:hypothetical protein